MPREGTVYSVGLQMWTGRLMQKGLQAMESNEKGFCYERKFRAQMRGVFFVGG